MKTATFGLLIAMLLLTPACNRESSRARRGAKAAAAEHSVTITDENFQREVQDFPKPVLVEFWHENSEDCQKFAPVIEELAVEFEGRLKVGKLDIARNPKLPEFHAVRNASPVTILFMGNREVERYVGLKTKDEIAARLNQLLGPKR